MSTSKQSSNLLNIVSDTMPIKQLCYIVKEDLVLRKSLVRLNYDLKLAIFFMKHHDTL